MPKVKAKGKAPGSAVEQVDELAKAAFAHMEQWRNVGIPPMPAEDNDLIAGTAILINRMGYVGDLSALRFALDCVYRLGVENDNH